MAKGTSRKKFRWNAVCDESRTHGVETGKIWTYNTFVITNITYVYECGYIDDNHYHFAFKKRGINPLFYLRTYHNRVFFQ
jgi:hypothetical protein